MTQHDVLVIGAGPAGIAAAATLHDAGLDVLTVEQGALADAILRWPTFLRFFSTAANLELAGFPLIITDEKPTREEYLTYIRRFVREKKLRIETRRRVERVERDPATGRFTVRGSNPFGEPFVHAARFVVVATGAYDQPQMLGVPGEDLPKVSHYFTEVHPYADSRVAIVGGRSSAAECALLLWRAGAEVTVIHRGEALRGLKYWVQPDIDNRIRAGEIRALFHARVTAIHPHEVVVEQRDPAVDGGAPREVRVPNDFVLAMTGYQPDVRFLRAMGIEVNAETREPVCDPETLETNVPGLFVAGVILAGTISGAIFIENSRHHGEMILAGIRAKGA